MKVLFVGEGREDIGPSEFGRREQPARGPIPILSRKAGVAIDEDCPAVRWVDLRRFPVGRTRPGYDYKVEAAILVSAVLQCEGTICVADRDRDLGRLEQMHVGRERGLLQVNPRHRCVCGIAVESIEAWTLGAPDAIAAVLDIDQAQVRKQYPHHRIEELHERSGKLEHQPKALLESLAALRHRRADVDFREEVAQHTDLAKLEQTCQLGFKPFADALRLAFPIADGAMPTDESEP